MSIHGANTNIWLIKHGLYGTQFYKCWQAIKVRCDNSQQRVYNDYGARGIKHFWPTFQSFYDDMYASYVEHVNIHGTKKTQIDRINNDGDYTKENCRWVTPKENNRNKRTTRYLTFKGKTQCLSAWAEELGLDRRTLHMRLVGGWSIQQALSTPLQHRGSRIRYD